MAQFERLLRGQRLDVGHLDVSDYPQLLLVGFGFSLPLFLLENISIQAKFSCCNDILLHEEALLSAAEGAATDFFALISNCRIWVQARLLFPSLGSPNVCCSLGKCRIV